MNPPRESYMRRAIELARRAEGRTRPNPAVGAVLVKDDQIVGEGYHRVAGSDHAEVVAIKDAGEAARGSTLYVTLEPCNHHGRTPPCTDAILEAGIERVVYSVRDPNREVEGGGAERLASEGVDVMGGILEDDVRYLNRFFLHHAETHRPWVIAKFASSLDGKTTTSSGESKWITGPEARRRSHELRSIVDAILVGSRTVLADDPELTARLESNVEDGEEPPVQPLRVVLDSRGRVPPTARVYDPKLPGRTITVGTSAFCPVRARELAERDVELIRVPMATRGRVHLDALAISLGDLGVQSLLIEGGSEVHGSFFDAGLVDEVWAFLSPSLIGGSRATSAVGGPGVTRLADRFQMAKPEIERVGDDILIRGIRSGWK